MRSETTKESIEQFMKALGRANLGSGRIYFAGGVSAVLLNWRQMTVDIDIKLAPEPEGIYDVFQRLKNELDINIEIACPDDFIPALPGWQDRSRFIARQGRIDFYHYDFYGQALAKLERFHARDESDVREMLASGLVERRKLLGLFDEIEAELKRFPAIEPEAFRHRVEMLTAED